MLGSEPDSGDTGLMGAAFATLNDTESPLSDAALLPPAFELLPRLLHLLDDPEADYEDLAKLIRIDAGLTADVLRIANSAHYSGGYRSHTVQDAILRLGLREIYRITVKVVTSPLFATSEDPARAKLDLWTHSLAVAVAAQAIARRTQSDSEIAFTIGLLHDLGKTILHQGHGADYVVLIEKCGTGNRPLWMAERSKFQTDHAEVGGTLLAEWNFPENVVTALTWHHDITNCPRPHKRIAAITNLANSLAYRMGHGYGCSAETTDPETDALHILAVSRDDYTGLEEQARFELDRERQVFQYQVRGNPEVR